MKNRLDQFAAPGTTRVIPSESNNPHDGVIACTADGKSLWLGMEVWDRNGDKSVVTLLDIDEHETTVRVVVHLSGRRGRWWNCFSTPEAALQAKKIHEDIVRDALKKGRS